MTRARDLGIPLPGRPGTHNAITDVPGVEVGYTTLIDGEVAVAAHGRHRDPAARPRGRRRRRVPRPAVRPSTATAR